MWIEFGPTCGAHRQGLQDMKLKSGLNQMRGNSKVGSLLAKIYYRSSRKNNTLNCPGISYRNSSFCFQSTR